MLYEILTEYKKPGKINKIVSSQFEGFNVERLTGYWKGIQEQAVKISIIAENTIDNDAKIKAVAARIKRVNDQESVLINKINNEYNFV